MKIASDTTCSRGVWSGREGSEEMVGGALESAELGATFEGAKDEFFGGPEPEDAAARGRVKGACVEYVASGVIENLMSRSRPLMLVTWERVTR